MFPPVPKARGGSQARFLAVKGRPRDRGVAVESGYFPEYGAAGMRYLVVKGAVALEFQGSVSSPR